MLKLIALMAIGSTLTGCASGWDTLTSRRFRESPFKTMFQPEDPLVMLRDHADDADIKARAFQHLTEKEIQKMASADQDFVLGHLGTAATSDPNPWVRIAAVDALGRFDDPRATQSLIAAFHQATGRTTESRPISSPEMPSSLLPMAAGRTPTALTRYDLTGPKGFTTDQVATIRGRAMESLAKFEQPEALQLLTEVALNQSPSLNDDIGSREFVRQQAVACLGTMRSPESVQALSKVLNAEQGRDLTLSRLAHQGLVDSTGQKHPADPETWNRVVQTGHELAPPQNAIQRAIGFRTP
jgi:hypothetical protein